MIKDIFWTDQNLLQKLFLLGNIFIMLVDNIFVDNKTCQSNHHSDSHIQSLPKHTSLPEKAENAPRGGDSIIESPMSIDAILRRYQGA